MKLAAGNVFTRRKFVPPPSAVSCCAAPPDAHTNFRVRFYCARWTDLHTKYGRFVWRMARPTFPAEWSDLLYVECKCIATCTTARYHHHHHHTGSISLMVRIPEPPHTDYHNFFFFLC